MVKKNLYLVTTVIKNLIACGVRHVCIAPGGRNAPFVYFLKTNPSLFETYWFYEERSMAFFALGLSRKMEAPIAVITTSGTAVTELFPALIESYFGGGNLFLITADRPKAHRGTGSAQTIYQEKIFGRYVSHFLDLDDEKSNIRLRWPGVQNIHINCCFDEPLVSDDLNYTVSLQKSNRYFPEFQKFDPLNINEYEKFLKSAKDPFVIVGALPEGQQEAAKKHLLYWKLPIYAESLSGLRSDKDLRPYMIYSLEDFQKKYHFQSVIRLGGVPLAKLWKNLEHLPHIPILSISHLKFSGLARHQIFLSGDLRALPVIKRDSPSKSYYLKVAKKNRLKGIAFYREVLENYPYSDLGWIAWLSKRIPIGSFIYLGNSLPIRQFDLIATHQQRNFHIMASRGANGIDGQISTFLGLSDPQRENWAILGDLTAMYDFAGLWSISSLKDRVLRIVVINNGGGKIFHSLFSDNIFQNQHSYTFNHFAKFWQMPYKKLTDHHLGALHPHQWLEINPRDVQTNAVALLYKKYYLNG